MRVCLVDVCYLHGWIGSPGHGVVALRLIEPLPELFNLVLQTAGFETLIPQLIPSGLGSPVEAQHRIDRPADGKQDDAGELDGSQKIGHCSSED